MPIHTVPRRLIAAVAVLGTAAPLLAGCALRSTDPEHDTKLALDHIHGLAVDPATGILFIASHGGIYTLDGLTSGAELDGPIAGNDFDAMGFTFVDGVMYASGHPGKNSPEHFGDQNLGLIRSDDAARTWDNISAAGEADFHDLAVAVSDTNRIYANNYGIVHRSDDGGRTWSEGAGIDAWDITVDPTDPDTVYASTSLGLQISTDGGRTFNLDPDAPRMGRIALFDDGRLVGDSVDGHIVYQAADGQWVTGPEVVGAAQALAVTPDQEVLLVDDRGIQKSTTLTTFELLYRPEPHI